VRGLVCELAPTPRRKVLPIARAVSRRQPCRQAIDVVFLASVPDNNTGRIPQSTRLAADCRPRSVAIHGVHLTARVL
jgi:hypothetical protein